ncbi:hypothetical protein HY498_03970 [Candidatus Woesearchaeota archaeon]|nr:hypothetical protein [Candidatus Woesearchaeota archaeon]
MKKIIILMLSLIILMSFNVLASEPTNNLKLIYPNGGETFAIGDTVVIRWDLNIEKVPENDVLEIALEGETVVGVATIKSVKSNGEYKIKIPEFIPSDYIPPSLPPGKYKISIRLYDGTPWDLNYPVPGSYTQPNLIAKDESDDKFNIVKTGGILCTDSDGGLNYYVKGKIVLNNVKEIVDQCSDAIGSNGPALIELYCDPFNKSGVGYSFDEYNCPNGCLYGACISGPTTNKPPIIISVGGPTSLKVNEMGKWSIEAYDPDGKYLKYSVDWGENVTYPRSEASNREISQEATFIHSYSKSGTYKVVFTVTDEKGGKAQSSISVNVGGDYDSTWQEFSLGKGETKVFREEGIKVRLKDILIMAVDYANKSGKNEYRVEVEIIDSAPRVVLYEIKTLGIGDEVEFFNKGKLKLIDIQTLETNPVQYMAKFGIRFEKNPIACSACINGKPSGKYDENGCMIFDCPPTTQNIPSSVLTKYEELERSYRKSLGASISFCTKDTEKIYVVSGSGGFTAIVFYYTENGNEISSYEMTDAEEINNPPPKPPVNIKEYKCTIIKKSEQFQKECKQDSDCSPGICPGGSTYNKYTCNDGRCFENKFFRDPCGGITNEKQCPQLGYREKGKYCNINLGWEDQKSGKEYCDNDFECSSNSCLDSKCTEVGFWDKIFSWLTKLFG